MAKNPKLTVDEENDQRAQYAGMLKHDIESAYSSIQTRKSKAATISGDLSAKLELFEKAGGHKKAIKWASAIAALEPAEAQDIWRSLEGYVRALGVFDQIDMFEQQRENDLNAESIAVASQAPEISEEHPFH